jgi:glucokinase
MNERTGRRLLADVGGTHTRVAVQAPGAAPERIAVFDNHEHAGLGALFATYLDRIDDPDRPRRAAIAVAAPVAGEEFELTNLAWRCSSAALRAELRLEELLVLNDFEALARAVPFLDDGDRVQIGPGHARPGAVIGVLGPGTGLGVAAAVPAGDRWIALATEGGHVTLAPGTEEEDGIVRLLRARFGHVSAERAVCGPGLANLYAALRDGEAPVPAPEAITRAAQAGSDPTAARALAIFFALLGSTAGDLALSLGAHGGIYLGGGILPPLVEALRRSAFRERFEAKGRFREYLAGIPTFVIVDPFPAFRGLAAALDER